MRAAMATVQSDIFKPTKFGGKYTVTLIPGISSRPASVSVRRSIDSTCGR